MVTKKWLNQNHMKQITLSCDHPAIKNGECRLDIPAKSVLAIVQALEFVLQNMEKFSAEVTSCPDCIEEAGVMQQVLSGVLERVLEEERKRTTN